MTLLIKKYNKIFFKRQFVDSPTGSGLHMILYSPGSPPVCKSNRPAYSAFSSGSALKAGLLLGIFILLLSVFSVQAQISSAQSGTWSSTTTWTGGVIPTANDDVVVSAGHTVTIDAAAASNDLTINGTLAISGTNTLTVTGNWKNDGIFTANNSIVEFTGNSDVLVSGNSPSAFYDLTINKTNGLANTIDFTSTGTVSCSHTLKLTSGLLKLTSGTVNLYCNSAFTIAKPAGIWVNAATLNTGGFSITNEGLIRISAGTANFGTQSGNSVHTQIDGAFEVTGGNVFIAGRLENTAGGYLVNPSIPSGLNISGGTVTVGTVGNGASSSGTLDVSTNGAFNFTSGTIIFQYSSTATTPLDVALILGSGSGAKSTSGGTFQLGNGSTPAGTLFRIKSEIPIDNLTLAANASVLLVGSDLTISNQLKMQGGNIDGATNNKKVILSKANINALDNSSGFINGTLERAIGTGAAYLFPVGNTTNGTTPLTLSFSGQNSGGSITVSSVSGVHGNLGSSLLSTTGFVNNYWTYANNGVTFSSIDASFTSPSDITTSYKIGVFDSGWTYPDVLHTLPRNVRFSGISSPGPSVSFAIAECTPPTITLGTNPVVCQAVAVTSANLPYTATTGLPDRYRIDYADSGFPDVGTTTLTATPISLSIPAGLAPGTYNATLYVSNAADCESSGTAFSITVNPVPTLSGASQPSTACENNPATITLTGLIPNSTFNLDYSINGTAQTQKTGLNADASGNSSFTTSNLTSANNGQTLRITGITITSATPNCPQAFARDVVLAVNSLPVISCPVLPISLTATTGTCAATATYSVTATSIPAATFTYTFTGATTGSGNDTGTGSSFNAGSTTVKVTATNLCGSSSCTFTVTVTDNEKPTITCSPAITQNVDAGTCGKVVTYTAPTGTDNCPGSTTAQIAGLPSGSTFPVGTTTNTFVVTDASGNTNTCSFTVIITDNVAPVISGCPVSPVTVYTGPGRTSCDQIANWTEPTATDNCTASGSLVWTKSHTSGSTFPVGTTTITYTVKDAIGNTATCTFTITVVDNTPPIPPPLSPIVAQCSVTLTPPSTADNYAITPPTTTDNCSGTVTGTTTTTFPYTATGVTSIFWTFTDMAGNTTTQTQLVTIQDATSPVFVLANFPTDKTLECATSLDTSPTATGTPTATDNCSTVTITYTDNKIVTPGNCSGIYNIERTWKATDLAGKYVTKVQIINIVDTTPPVPGCINFSVANPDLIPLSDEYVNVSFTDNCGITKIDLIYESYEGLGVGAGFCPTSVVRTYKAYDCGGNTSTCTQTITVSSPGTCKACQAEVPFRFADLRGNPNGRWELDENIERQGICCGVTQTPPGGPPRCMSFNVYLDKDAVGLIFTVRNPGPSGSEYYQVDCGPKIPLGQVICLTGDRIYTVTFCKPGNDKPIYVIQSISGATTTEDITTRADANCIKNIVVTGLEQNSFLTWKVKFPTYANADTLLNRLSCTNCLTPTFTPNKYTPPTIIYEVCGQILGSYQCSATPIIDCAEVTVTTLPAITIGLPFDPGNMCANNIIPISANVQPVSNYTFKWYDGPNGTGNLLPSTGPTWTPTINDEGDFSVVATEVVSVLPTCNSSVGNFNLHFDTAGPLSLTVPATLSLDCNLSSTDFDLAVATWLASATASDTNISSIPVSNDYATFSHSCGAVKTVKFWANDVCGNTTSATAEIHITDTTPPIITTPATNQTVECDGAGNTTALNSWLSSSAGSVATDACAGTLTWTNSYTALSDLCGATGVATVTFTVTDACGNTATTVASFTIIDTQAPTITCPAPVSGIANSAECFATGINLGTPIASDVCSGATVSLTNNAPAQLPVGITTVTWTASDACGNTATCTQLVTITDNNQPPTITCPGNYEEIIAANMCSKTGVSPGAPAVWDNCPNPALSYTMTGVTTGSGTGTLSNTTFNVGVTTVTYTVTDAGGGTASCSFTVWIKRLDIPPTAITCPASPTPVNAVSGTCSAPVMLSAPVISDPCSSIVSVVHNSIYGTSTSDASGTYPVGTTTVTWTITDTSGNVKSCTQTVTVVDTQAPVFTSCPTNQEQQIINGGCNLTNVTVPNPVASDNCSIDRLTWTMSGATTGNSPATGINYVTGQTFNIGITTVTYTAMDASGLTATCTFTVWMKSLNTPQFSVTCPTGATATATTGLCNADIIVPSPGINNPCTETYTITNDRTGTANASGNFPVGTTTITWTVTDASGNITTCTQTVSVVDTQAPVFTSCPVNQEQQIINGGCNLANVTVPDPVVSDNCSIDRLIWTMSGATTGNSPPTGINYVTGQTFNVGITTVSYTAVDVNGLTATCTFTVWMKSLNAPQFSVTCPAGATATATTGLCNADVIVPSPGINNPCTETYTITNDRTGTANASGNFPVGTTTITWTVTDASGNITTCTQTVSVVDTQAPVFTSCPVNQEQQIINGGCNLANVTVPDPVVSDNCSIDRLIWTMSGATTGSSPATGINYVTGQTFNVGITTVSYTAVDVNGLTATCTFTVWMKNLSAPKLTVTCPTNVTLPADAGKCDAFVSVPSPAITNPCTETYTVTNNITGTDSATGTYEVGTTTVTWTITDASGNITTCTQYVTVTDLMPTIDCPDNITGLADYELPYKDVVYVNKPTYDDNCPDPVLTWEMTGATAGSSTNTTGESFVPSPGRFNVGVTVITYTVTDANGNTASCSFTVNILAKPEITCLNDITGNTDTGTCTYSVDPGVPTLDSGVQPITWTWTITSPDGTTASGTSTSTVSNPTPSPIGVFNFQTGTSTITWRAENVSGFDECTQLVTVEDKEPPTFTAAPSEFCVEDLFSSDYIANNLKVNPDPDYALFKAGSTLLDLDPDDLKNHFDDNCCADDELEIHWRIVFSDTPNPSAPPANLNHAPIPDQTGQPSTYGSDIKLPGDGVNYTNIVHHITYWLIDCHGNKSEEKEVTITVKPRPRFTN